MTLAVRVIPCLDIADGRVVKGVKFLELRDAGDPVALARAYSERGADELTFLDITASHEGRETTLELVRQVAAEISIPFTVGGGVRTVDDFQALLRAGADKVSVSTGAITRPELLREAAERFGAQCVVLSMDVSANEQLPSGYEITTHGGRTRTGIDAVRWVQEAVALGAGEILLNSMDADGTKSGFDLDLIQRIRQAVTVPVIASGGAGSAQDFVEAVQAGANAVLAASVFHFGTLSIAQVKTALAQAHLPVRPAPAGDGWVEQVQWDERGLAPVVVQDAHSHEVLMLAWANAAALTHTLTTGHGAYWSRSRQALWIKGETSGHRQQVLEVRLDCDADALLYRVHQQGPACHTGLRSCFDSHTVEPLEAE